MARWTPEEDEILRTLYPTRRISVLVGLLKRTEGSIRMRACALNLKKAEGYHGKRARLPGEEHAPA